MPRLSKTTEQKLVEALARVAGGVGARGVVVGIGDDAAAVRPATGQDLLLTTDVHVEGRHFRRAWFSGVELGWRLAAVNLSDIAAMGGAPSYAVLSLVLPDDVNIAYAKDIERGVARHLARHGAAIVGGNVSATDGSIVCDLTLAGSVARGRAWKRSCRPGRDAIVLIGTIGESRAGLEILRRAGSRRGREGSRFKRLVKAYKRPKPLLAVAKLLREESAVHGAIDVSDGFATDLGRVCRASAAGCEVDASAIPIARTLRAYCRACGGDPLDFAINGGEDYALILAVDSRKAEMITSRVEQSLGLPARVTGRFTRRRGRYELVTEGHRKRLVPRGWDHFGGRR